VAVVQHIFAHKQYTEQHNKTQYTENSIHNNKNTKITKLNVTVLKISPISPYPFNLHMAV